MAVILESKLKFRLKSQFRLYMKFWTILFLDAIFQHGLTSNGPDVKKDLKTPCNQTVKYIVMKTKSHLMS